ncbi:MAG: TIGR00730 family Rossman fold protein [Candidatus Obscuribacterales bacterium]|nr:TIGR00730 family Rossman fold protein [Steroidobacteraceae bacterium]
MNQSKLLSVGVFCGSSLGVRPEYQDAARDLGRLLAEQNITLIYGGGRIGLMGVIADAALEVGGRVVGVIPKILYSKEVAHEGLTELRVVESMSARKNVISEISDAFIALPGGIGTMDELFEVWTWTQLGLQHKLSGLLNVAGYFDPLLTFIDRAVAEGFLRPQHRETLHVGIDARGLLARLEAAA